MKVVESLKKMPPERAIVILRAASVLAILGLCLMLWSLFDPTPAPVLVGLSVGQALGTMSFAAFLVVVLWDQRRRRRGGSILGSGTSVPPPEPSEGDVGAKSG